MGCGGGHFEAWITSNIISTIPQNTACNVMVYVSVCVCFFVCVCLFLCVHVSLCVCVCCESTKGIHTTKWTY